MTTLIDSPRRVLAGLLVLLVLAVATAAHAFAERVGEPAPESAPAGEFSAGRALDHLARFAREPRPLGSAANDRTEDYLAGELRSAGLEVEVQRAVGAYADDGVAAFGRVDNIVATLPGADPTGTVMLAAHHDSVGMGPGASDDGAAVAAMLETVRALRTGDRPRNDIVLLITDGEEDGLLGADAFVREHPLGRRGAVVLNFEARGVGGPSLMFETSRDNAGLVGAFTDAVPHPRGDSSMVEVYRLLPNNTDFTPFMAGGLRGLNFAYIEGAARYHTAADSIANLDRGSLQHHGENMLALARALGAADLGTLAADHDDTYFRVLGLTVSYPNGAVWPLAVLAVLLVALLTWLARRRGLVTVPRVLLGAASALVPLAVSFGLGQLFWTVLVWLRPAYDSTGGLLHRPVAYHAALILLGVLALLGWYLLLRRRLGPAALAAGGLAWPALLGVVCAVFAPGMSFLFTMPALFAALGFVGALLLNRPLWSVGVAALGLVVGSALLPYFGYMSFVAVGLELGGAGSLFTVLFGLLGLPVVELLLPARGPRRGTAALVPAAVLVLAVALTGAGLVVDRPDSEHPASSHLAYVLDAGASRASWVSAEREPTAWTGGYVRDRSTEGLPPGFARGELWTGPAPVLDLDGPAVEVRSRTDDTVTLWVASRRDAPALTLRLDAPVTRVTVEGENPVTVDVAGTREASWPGEIRFRDPPPDGVELTVHTRATRLTAMDETRGLTGVPGFRSRPPDLTASARHDGDVVSVARTVRLPGVQSVGCGSGERCG
ncbi:M20/M25/M40 family metallo-hydrolase [Actinophytocola sp.]|uniref:M20/M25/M40 family metallo-hydrolase n=1 Tax=Actinophytocola sp. TaxID=1872138 RepID=UPI003D6AC958